jgi:hypothetical protein
VGGALKFYAFQSETMLNNFLGQPKLNVQPINESFETMMIPKRLILVWTIFHPTPYCVIGNFFFLHKIVQDSFLPKSMPEDFPSAQI